MKKYKVVFEFRNSRDEWKPDYFSNNGVGFTYDEAAEIRDDLRSHGVDSIPVRNVNIEEV